MVNKELKTTYHNDISETKDLENRDKRILTELLKDRTTGQNIIWATSDYLDKYKDENLYGLCAEITKKAITGSNDKVIVPRYLKAKAEQQKRTKDKAEVFTPSWVCCIQNNYPDEQRFGEDVFAKVDYKNKTWETKHDKIDFSKVKEKVFDKNGKQRPYGWQDYIKANVMETCGGEFPYLVSRYNTVTGETIPIKDRIGLLDRKLRVIKENYMDEVIKSDYHPGKKEQWKEWAMEAVKHTYGYEWQGDNLLLGRENVLFTVIEHYQDVFGEDLTDNDYLVELAKVISWNLWQMDGLKFVVPMSCEETAKKSKSIGKQLEDHYKKFKDFTDCNACRDEDKIEGIRNTTAWADTKNKLSPRDYRGHIGIPCKVKNWDIKVNGDDIESKDNIIYFGNCLDPKKEESKKEIEIKGNNPIANAFRNKQKELKVKEGK